MTKNDLTWHKLSFKKHKIMLLATKENKINRKPFPRRGREQSYTQNGKYSINNIIKRRKKTYRRSSLHSTVPLLIKFTHKGTSQLMYNLYLENLASGCNCSVSYVGT